MAGIQEKYFLLSSLKLSSLGCLCFPRIALSCQALVYGEEPLHYKEALL